MEFALVIRPTREDFISTISEIEQDLISQHFEYLRDLSEKGIVTYAGRCEDGEFGIILIESDCHKEADKIVLDDPAIKNGIFNYKLHSFRTAIRI